MSRKHSKKSRGPSEPSAVDPLFGAQQAASMTECTGILPAQVETPEEQRAIAALGAIHPPENDSL